MKKGVAICKKEWYNNEVAWGKHKQQKSLKTQKKAFKSNERDFKKLFKNFEKSVDKRKWMWYNNSRTVERGSVRTDKKLSKKCVGPWKLNNEKDKGTRNTLRILKDLQWDAHNKASEITDTLVFGMSD